jgi:hypothetical protein
VPTGGTALANVGPADRPFTPGLPKERLTALIWHACGMARVRISTTVDGHLLEEARRLRVGTPDASLIDQALTELVRAHRRTEIDTHYEAAYREHPASEPDEWGDLESWADAAQRS